MDYEKTINELAERSEAIGILMYAEAGPELRAALRKKALAIIDKFAPDVGLSADFHGSENRDEYADLDRESRTNISNHELTEDQRLDDPRHTEIH